MILVTLEVVFDDGREQIPGQAFCTTDSRTQQGR